VASPPNPQVKFLVGFLKVKKSITEEIWGSYHGGIDGMKKES